MLSVVRLARALGVFLALYSFGLSALASDDSHEEIRRRIEAMASGFEVSAGPGRLLAVDALAEFYQERGFTLAWFKDGRLGPEALELLQTIDGVGLEGLRPRDYHQQALSRMIQELTLSATRTAKADLDLLLSDAFLILGSHLLVGKVDPQTLKARWTADRHGLEMAPLLSQAVETGSVAALLNTFRPSQPEYRILRQQRQHILGLLERRDWRLIDNGPLIRPGTTDARLPLIRARLRALRDMAGGAEAATPAGENDSQSPVYDTTSLAAVSRFQARHGLKADGVIGPETVHALNRAPQDRLQQIEVNMERWRWLPERLGEPHIRVNTAAGHLNLVNNGEIRFSSAVRLSSACHQRPVFSDQVHYLVRNPEWTVKPGDPNFALLAELRNQEQFAELGFELHRGWGSTLSREDALGVQWPGADDTTGAARLVQPAGQYNAMGEVKFMSQAGDGPVLHGTPAEGLLSPGRGTTFGCLQVEAAAELADGLLQPQRPPGEQPGQRRQKAPETFFLERPVPLHVQYLTAWVDRDGIVRFHDDVLSRDAAVADALAAGFR